VSKNHCTHHDDCGCLSARYEARIAALEAELAEAREHAEAWESEADSANTLGQSWMAHANALRDALERVRNTAWIGGNEGMRSMCQESLSQTPAASLAALKAEVLERARVALNEAKADCECGNISALTTDAVIRALAAQEQGVYAYCAVCGKPVARGECDGNPPHSHSRCALAAQEVKP